MWAKFFLTVSTLLLLFTWIYPALHFAQIPETVPVHFDGQGNADGFGSRNMVWLEAGIATLLFGMCVFIFYRPQMINLPEDMKKNLNAVKNFIAVFSTVITGVFAYMMYSSIRMSLGESEGFSFPPGLLIGLMYIVIIGLMIYLGKVGQRKENKA